MDIRQMRYFLAVVDEGQITKAAERLHIAQSALSQQIRQMEEELGQRLFERHGRYVELTQGGHILRMRAEQMISLFHSTIQELQDTNEGQSGILNIATLASSDTYVLQLLQNYISIFHETYPNVTYQMWAGDTSRIQELLDRELVEIGIVRTPVDFRKYTLLDRTKKSLLDPMVAVYDRKWDSGIGVDLITMKDLKDKPLILHRRNQQKTIDACRNHGFEPNIFCISDDIRAMLTWAETGLGITILTNSSVFALQNKQICIREIDEQALKSEVVMIRRKEHYLSAVARNFIEILNSRFE